MLRLPPDKLDGFLVLAMGLSMLGAGLFVTLGLITGRAHWWSLSPLGILCFAGGWAAIGAAIRECRFPNNTRRRAPNWPKE